LIELDFRLPLSRFSLDVRCTLREKVTAIVGESGAGKTSLIESIAGLRSAVGRIVIDGTDVSNLPPEQRKIGYVPQDVALFPHLDVRSNMRYGGSEDFDSICDTLELGPLLDRSPTTLSGGERQRVAIARALMTRPRLLLLDEPLASVDQPLRERILLFLRRVRDRGLPMIYATHQPFEAIALGSWCIVLRKGSIVAEGHPRDTLVSEAAGAEVENAFEVSDPRHDPEQGVTRVHTADGLQLVLPYDRVATAIFPLLVRISGEEIVVFAERPSSISSRNLMEGTIESTHPREGFVDLIISVPTRIRVRVTRSAADELRLRDGSRVWVAMRSRAFRIVG
jgi:molybdate transport system ATP-binding protein